MELSIMNFYLEPGNELDFDDRVNRKLLKALEKEFFKGELRALREGWTLMLNISPSKRVKYNRILGPAVVRSTQYLVYTVKVPYKVIMGDKNPAAAYEACIRQALQTILERDYSLAKKN